MTKESLQLRGSWRANRNPGQPQPPTQTPPCPDWLDEDAKAMFEILVELLSSMRVLTSADSNALARYCAGWSRWKRAELFLQKYGSTYPLKDEKGRVRCFMPWPQVAEWTKLNHMLKGLEQEFGLTPSARTRISASGEAPKTPEEIQRRDFFNREAYCAALKRRDDGSGMEPTENAG
jgi:P27 family predicted phage terminase small subunit